jgi:hypothetical protein
VCTIQYTTTTVSKQWRIVVENEETIFSVIENKLPYRIIKTGLESLGEARKALALAERELGGNIDLAIRKESLFN